MKRLSSFLTALLMVVILCSLAGCAAAGVNNGTAGIHAGSQDTSSATQTTAIPTSDPVPSTTTQPEPVRMDVPGPEWSVPLTVEMQDAINEAIYEKNGSKSDLTWDEDSYWCIRYYGTYDGHIVYFIDSPLCVVTEIVLGDQTIMHGYGCTIWVYSDGELCTLEEAYYNGLLTDAHISLINQYHKEYNKAYREWLLSQYGE